MKRMSWHLVVPLALISALSVPAGCVEFDKYSYDPTPGAGGSSSSSSSGAAGMGGTGGAGGMMGMPCPGGDPDCAALNSECQTDGKCQNGFCSWTFPQAGTQLAVQVYGDCNQITCDGMGGIDETNIDNGDKYVWGNPCYAPTCGTDTPLASAGTACTTKWGGGGKCQIDFSCLQCTVPADCMDPMTPVCQSGKCVPDHCMNGSLDGDETDANCGGSCAPCDVTKKCSTSNDCVGNGRCLGNPKVCQAPDCNDTIKNGDETGVDCGGTCAMDPMNQKCPTNSGCLYPSDCQSVRCEAGVCK